MPDRTNRPKTRFRISRRDFVRGAALATASAAMPHRAFAQQAPQLSAEAEGQAQAIFSKYGNHFSDEQKADVRRLVAQNQKAGEALRAFPLDNSNEPAAIFHVYRSGRKQKE